jgi:hypothetical protein
VLRCAQPQHHSRKMQVKDAKGKEHENPTVINFQVINLQLAA